MGSMYNALRKFQHIWLVSQQEILTVIHELQEQINAIFFEEI